MTPWWKFWQADSGPIGGVIYAILVWAFAITTNGILGPYTVPVVLIIAMAYAIAEATVFIITDKHLWQLMRQ